MFKRFFISLLGFCVGGIFTLQGVVIGTQKPAYLRLKNLSSLNGMPGETVRSLFQTSDGFIWMGIEPTGLCRFDGVNYTIFEHSRSDSTTLSSDFIETIAEDSQGHLWIGTDNGLNRLTYNIYALSKGQGFIRFYHCENDSNSISGNSINCLFKDSKGVLWIGSDGGLDMLNQDGNSFHRFGFPGLSKSNLFSVYALFEDRLGQLWVGTNQGLFLLSANRQFLHHWPSDVTGWSNNVFMAIHQDPDGRIWLGTHRGLFILNEAGQKVDHVDFSGHASPLNTSGINTITRDHRNNMWVCTQSGGLLVYESQTGQFQYLHSKDHSPGGIATNQIRDVIVDHDHRVWIAAKNKGLYIYDLRLETFDHITERAEKNLGLSDKQVLSIYEDMEGQIWIGTRFGGLNQYDPITRRFHYYQYNASNPEGIGSNRIESIEVDLHGIFWLGTVNGLVRFDRSRNQFVRFNHGPIKVVKVDPKGTIWIGSKEGLYYFDPSLQKTMPVSVDSSEFPFNQSVAAMVIDHQHRLWIGTHNSGLIHYDPCSGEYKHFTSKNRKGDLSSNMIRSIYEDEDHRIWVGTKQSGLNLYDDQTDGFRVYTTEEGLPSNSVFSITGDEQGHLWLATNKGVSKLDRASGNFFNFSMDDGLQGDVFISGAICKARDGKIYFGGDNGMNVVNPGRMVKHAVAAPIVFTAIRVNESYLKDDHLRRNEVVVSYNDILSFEFALLDYHLNGRKQYFRFLKGYDKDWVECGQHNFVSFTKLPPGKYQLLIKGKDSDSIFSVNEAMIAFEVLPPWWRTWIAIAIEMLVFSLLVFLAYRLVRYRALKEHEVAVLKLEKEHTEKMSRFKIHFFTNVSHEFRTPLTLMLPLVERLMQLNKMPMEGSTHLNMLEKHTRKLLSLVDELLLFRKLEQGLMPLKYVKRDVVGFIEEVSSVFKEAALIRNIDFKLRKKIEYLEMPFDPGAMEKIISNLLSNAYKYTPENGSIELIVDKKTTSKELVQEGCLNHSETECLEVIVRDNGKGIPKEAMEQIFNRYYMAGNESFLPLSGSGIGLDFTRTLIHQHHGVIYAESTEGVSTSFVFLLPVNLSFYQNDLCLEGVNAWEKYPLDVELYSMGADGADPVVGDDYPGNETKTILVVDDEKEILEMIRETLMADYQVILASDGVSALNIANDRVPDLIVSDVSMPGLDGYRLCRRLKTSFNTSHIPVILLSAKADIENRIEGLGCGADSYISKPFYLKQLQTEISNLIRIRQQLIDRFRKESIAKPSELLIPTNEEKFISRCLDAVEKHMSDPLFGVIELGQEIGLSRAQLFRKLKAIIGLTPIEFIHSTRLKRAAKLLSDKKYPIAEVAYMTGFSNPASFSTAFRKYFNMTPSQYVTKTAPSNCC